MFDTCSILLTLISIQAVHPTESSSESIEEKKVTNARKEEKAAQDKKELAASIQDQEG